MNAKLIQEEPRTPTKNAAILSWYDKDIISLVQNFSLDVSGSMAPTRTVQHFLASLRKILGFSDGEDHCNHDSVTTQQVHALEANAAKLLERCQDFQKRWYDAQVELDTLKEKSRRQVQSLAEVVWFEIVEIQTDLNPCSSAVGGLAPAGQTDTGSPVPARSLLEPRHVGVQADMDSVRPSIDATRTARLRSVDSSPLSASAMMAPDVVQKGRLKHLEQENERLEEAYHDLKLYTDHLEEEMARLDGDQGVELRRLRTMMRFSLLKRDSDRLKVVEERSKSLELELSEYRAAERSSRELQRFRARLESVRKTQKSESGGHSLIQNNGSGAIHFEPCTELSMDKEDVKLSYISANAPIEPPSPLDVSPSPAASSHTNTEINTVSNHVLKDEQTDADVPYPAMLQNMRQYLARKEESDRRSKDTKWLQSSPRSCVSRLVRATRKARPFSDHTSTTCIKPASLSSTFDHEAEVHETASNVVSLFQGSSSVHRSSQESPSGFSGEFKARIRRPSSANVANTGRGGAAQQNDHTKVGHGAHLPLHLRTFDSNRDTQIRRKQKENPYLVPATSRWIDSYHKDQACSSVRLRPASGGTSGLTVRMSSTQLTRANRRPNSSSGSRNCLTSFA